LGKLILLYDISEEKRTQEQLQDHQRKFASLEEREWLARELHDGVGQALAAAHLQVTTATELLVRGQVAGTKASLAAGQRSSCKCHGKRGAMKTLLVDDRPRKKGEGLT